MKRAIIKSTISAARWERVSVRALARVPRERRDPRRAFIRRPVHLPRRVTHACARATFTLEASPSHHRSRSFDRSSRYRVTIEGRRARGALTLGRSARD